MPYDVIKTHWDKSHTIIELHCGIQLAPCIRHEGIKRNKSFRIGIYMEYHWVLFGSFESQ